MKTTFFLLFITLSLLASESRVAAQWVQTNGPTGGDIFSLTTENGKVFAGSNDGLYVSADSGASWSLAGWENQQVLTLAGVDSQLFACMNPEGGLRSTNDGVTWVQLESGLTENAVNAIESISSRLFAATLQGGVFSSADNGVTWTAASNNLPSGSISSLAAMDTILFAGTPNGVYLTTDYGVSWYQAGLVGSGVYSVTAIGSKLIAGYSSGISYSTDEGTTWTSGQISGQNPSFVRCAQRMGNDVYAGTNSGVFRSSDSGATWQQELSYANVYSMTIIGNKIIVGTLGGGIYRSLDSGTTWSTSNINLTALEVKGLVVFDGDLLAGTYIHGMFRSTDNGATWNASSSGIQNGDINCLAMNGSNVLAGTVEGVLQARDTGAIWGDYGPGPAYALTWLDSTVFVGTGYLGIYYYSDTGKRWVATDSGLAYNPIEETYPMIHSLTSAGSNILAGSDSGVYRSTTNGVSWEHITTALTTTTVSALAVLGSTVFAGTPIGIFVSNDDGQNWTRSDSANTSASINAFIVNGTDMIAGTVSGVLISRDTGKSWQQFNTGLTDPYVYSLAVGNGNIYAGTFGGGVWVRALSQLGVENDPMPLVASLKSYPNPFSASTTFSLTTSGGYTRVSAVNLLGQEVARLFDGELAAGEHTFEWNAHQSPPGIYVCRVESGGLIMTRKLVVMR